MECIDAVRDELRWHFSPQKLLRAVTCRFDREPATTQLRAQLVHHEVLRSATTRCRQRAARRLGSSVSLDAHVPAWGHGSSDNVSASSHLPQIRILHVNAASEPIEDPLPGNPM